MNGPDALREAWEAHTGGTPTSVAGLVAAVGGTRAAAGILHLHPGTVRRYVNREKVGKTAVNRSISETQKTILGDVAQKQANRDAIAKIKANGTLGAHAAGDVNIHGAAYGSRYQGYRDVYEEIDVGDLEDFFDAIQAGDYSEAWDALEGEMFEYYSTNISDSNFADVEEFSLDFGE